MSTATATPSVAEKLKMLSAIPEKVTDKGGSKSPVVPITTELDNKLKEIAAIKSAIKDATGHLDLIMAEVIPQCEKMRRELSQKSQCHLTSISLSGVATLVCQNKYQQTPLSEEARLRSMFNGAFDDYFHRKVTITVDVDKISAEALELLVRDGAAMKTETLKVTETLHAARSTNPAVAAIADAAGLRPVSFLKF